MHRHAIEDLAPLLDAKIAFFCQTKGVSVKLDLLFESNML